MSKSIMICGTASSVGKSLICAGLCRIFSRDGYKTAPFKSQNMSLNSFVTAEGLEIGRAQAVQAQAANIQPSVLMNPILLKPEAENRSQVIINGKVYGNMSAKEYFSVRQKFIPAITNAYNTLANAFDIVVIEGAGSPVELNLNRDDFVNMGMAKIADAPVILVGDIDRGGVFASLYGTVSLLDEQERVFVKAVVVNKFRGDLSLFEEGRRILAEITKIPVAGVIPYFSVDIDDEDSLSEKLTAEKPAMPINIAVVKLPHMSNFTDFSAFGRTGCMGVRYAKKPRELENADLILIPGTKSTISDLRWLRKTGFEAEIKKQAAKGMPVIGICGGYQMLGEILKDPLGFEGGGEIAGMGLLPVVTEFTAQKRLTEVSGAVIPWDNVRVFGYEIHTGRSSYRDNASPFVKLDGGDFDGCIKGSVCGTYLHGFFDSDGCPDYIYKTLCARKGVVPEQAAFCKSEYGEYKQFEYDKLAAHLRRHLNMELIYKIVEEKI